MKPSNLVMVESVDDLDGNSIEPDTPETAPPLIHFVWVGSIPPEALMRRLQDWATLNPSSTILLWNEASISELDSEEVDLDLLFKLVKNHAATSDIARFAILAKYGGVYMDADIDACRPISQLFTLPHGFVGRESNWLLNGGAIGLPSKSQFARNGLRAMERMANTHGTLTNFMCGPPLVTELHRAMRRLERPVPTIIEAGLFYPENPFRFPRRTRSAHPSFGVHLYAHSWAEGNELNLRRRLARIAQPFTPQDLPVGARRPIQLELRRTLPDLVSAENP